MSLRDDVAAIVERLEAIEQLFNQYITTISASRDRDRERELKIRPESIRAEVAFDEATKRDAKNEADRLYAVRSSIRAAAWVALAAALLFAAISWSQLREMRLQAEQNFHQSQAANAAASNQAAQSFEQQLNIAQQQTHAAQETAATIQREMMQEQRAWIVPQPAALLPEQPGQPVTLNFSYANTGKTPAKNVRAAMTGALLRWGEPANLQDVSESSPNAFRYDQGVLLPNQQLPPLAIPIQNKTGQKVAFSNDLSDQYQAGSILFLIHGAITYVDIFGAEHWVKYCGAIYAMADAGAAATAPPAATKACAAYNSVDSN